MCRTAGAAIDGCYGMFPPMAPGELGAMDLALFKGSQTYSPLYWQCVRIALSILFRMSYRIHVTFLLGCDVVMTR